MDHQAFTASSWDAPELDGVVVPRRMFEVLRFERFEVHPSARTVLRDGRQVDIGGRAFDLLIVLLRARGEVVSRAAIVEQVWPRTIVEDNNLRVQVAILRKALGSARDLVKSVSGRGYILVA